MKTVEMLLAEQDTKTLSLLKKILERPGLYLGANRFDYLCVFMNGYTFVDFEQSLTPGNHKNEFTEMPNTIMQHWLLHTQLAALHSGEMHASQLFCRCFGTKKIAFEHYKEFLHYPVPEVSSKHPGDLAMEYFSSEHPHITGNVYWEISCFEKNHDLVQYNLIDGGIPKENMNFIGAAMKSIEQYGDVLYDWKDNIPADFYNNMARSLIADIEALIKNAGFISDGKKIYIRREPLFTQVRFLFHTSYGWRDDIEIIAKDENHDVLIRIIAQAQNCEANALIKCGCEVFEQVDFSNSWENNEISDMSHLITDEKTFLSQYLNWKANQLT